MAYEWYERLVYGYSKNNILNKYQMVENIIGIQYKMDRVKCQTSKIELRKWTINENKKFVT